MADETLLNGRIIDGTVLNPAISDENLTMLNNVVKYYADGTLLNTISQQSDIIHTGSVIDGYKIQDRMNVTTGEADLYLCEKDEQRYVLKLYRREEAVKADVIEKIKKIDSPYVARIVYAGSFGGRQFDIVPYYKNGSVQGKKYTLQELRETIIPELNEALRELHSHDIVHNDIKPANIMLNDNGRDIAVIDFGISSVKEDGNTIILTRTGFTPEYTAHEALIGIASDISDYYSLGITLYELYTGATPYKDLTPEQILQYSSVQKIPLPDEMDQSLKDLISGLTYYDITNRKDPSNPNRRWEYQDVKNWLDGVEQIVPGASSIQRHVSDNNLPICYSFKGEEYTDRHKLAVALAKNWDDAKKDLFNGMLSARFKETDQAFAVACMDAEDAYGTGINSDLLLFRILYRLDKSLEDFVWKDQHYNNIQALGFALQDTLWKSNKPNMSEIDELLKYKVISEYLLFMPDVPDDFKLAVDAIEKSFVLYTRNNHQRYMNYYLLGYLLSGRKILMKNNHEFSSVDELIKYLEQMLEISLNGFEKFCDELIEEDGNLDAQLESWLISIGKSETINGWKRKLAG